MPRSLFGAHALSYVTCLAGILLSVPATSLAADNPDLSAPPSPKEQLESSNDEHESAAPTVTFRDDEGTPRKGAFRSGHVGLEGGFVWFRNDAERRGGFGGGGFLGLTLNMALWDTIPIGVGFGFMRLSDRKSFSQEVVECRSYGNSGTEFCGDKSHSASSSVSTGYAALETGVQHRFRPAKNWSIVPGAHVGYLGAFGLSRGIGSCKDCAKYPVQNVTSSGAYAAPFLRVTFGESGLVGLSVHSRFFLSGDIATMNALSIDVLAP